MPYFRMVAALIVCGLVVALCCCRRNHDDDDAGSKVVVGVEAHPSARTTASSSLSTSQEIFRTDTTLSHDDADASTTTQKDHLQQQSSSGSSSSSAVIPSKFLGMDVHGDPVYVPLIGTGTWQYNDTMAYQSVCKAFEAGYTFVDTAFGYHNQRGVGRAIRDCWLGERTDLFVMTKIPGGLNAAQVHAAHVQNLLELGLEYVDHLMTHFPADWQETTASAAARQEEWLALEAIYKTGQARTIGISHYCSRHILDLMWVATVTPAINQVEYHIGSQDVDNVIDTCADFGITFMSFSPLCGPCQLDDSSDSLIDGELVTDVAAHYNVTGSQVALRFVVQQGIPVIPKSNTMEHIRSNFDIFDFELSEVDMARLKEATKPSAEAGDCDVKFVEQE